MMSWMSDDGLHVLSPGTQPSPDDIEEMTQKYQEHIRNSAVWDAMVEEFGEDQAAKMLKEFKVKRA